MDETKKATINWRESPAAEDILRRKGYAPQYRDIPVGDVDIHESMANVGRMRKSLLLDSVERYAIAMRQGDRFPALCAYRPKGAKKWLLICGFNRFHAAQKVGARTFHALAVDGDMEPFDVEDVAIEDNLANGVALSCEEAKFLAVRAHTEHGVSIKQAAERYKLHPNTIRESITIDDIRRVCDKIPNARSISDSALAKLSGFKDDHNVLRAAVTLMAEVKHTVEEAERLAREIRAEKTEAARIEAVERVRREMLPEAPSSVIRVSELHKLNRHLKGAIRLLERHTAASSIEGFAALPDRAREDFRALLRSVGRQCIELARSEGSE